MRALPSRATVLLGVAAAVAGAAVAVPSPVGAVSPDIVISQVYGGGGNTGAPSPGPRTRTTSSSCTTAAAAA